ncbi:hypothetical protein [Mycobacterium sp. IDR2000157661]|uniref:hypothetical protein n=1 Tax=Mycobacterium sp. IDR2000157661 TaxID=2867005 RepID=UPI001EEA969A|nr:hypothetical protein [Mycobacterium sp. IDR2000157661]ULE32873.1 hypothetical protein K3G64_22840 [Mycobacterium sp. IDR2000157661]
MGVHDSVRLVWGAGAGDGVRAAAAVVFGCVPDAVISSTQTDDTGGPIQVTCAYDRLARVAIPIYDVEISARINEKINSKKPGITKDEVWDVCYSRDHQAKWDYDEGNGGWRLLVKGRTIGGRPLLVILHPEDEDQGKWRLKTAIAEDG